MSLWLLVALIVLIGIAWIYQDVKMYQWLRKDSPAARGEPKPWWWPPWW